MNIIYKNVISVDDINAIRKSMGWRQDNPEQLQSSIIGSTLIVAAYDNEKVIGVARLIWDGGGSANIAGVLVTPEYCNLGIEEKIIEEILDYLRKQLKPGYGIQVDIRAFGYQESLYENIGFTLSTIERRGIPMHICLTNQIELTDKMFGQMGYVKD